MVAAGAAMAARGAMGRGATADSAPRDESGCRGAVARGETPVDHATASTPGAATLPRPVRCQRVGGACGCARTRHDGGREPGRAHRRRVRPDPYRRSTHSLGLVLATRHALIQLAARTRAARGTRLRRRARALSPAGSEPLATVLGARRATSPALAPAARLAARQRTRAPGVPPARLARRSKPGQTCLKKEFTEPVALLSTRPVDLPLPRTASGLSFNLLALRARCVGESMVGSRAGQARRPAK